MQVFKTIESVGGGLLPIAEYQLARVVLTRRHWGASPLHNLERQCLFLLGEPAAIIVFMQVFKTIEFYCGRGLLPDSGVSASPWVLTRRHRGASPSHDLERQCVWFYWASQPPSMFHAAPRTCAPASLHKNNTNSPNCGGVTKLQATAASPPANHAAPAAGRRLWLCDHRSASAPAASAPSRGRSHYRSHCWWRSPGRPPWSEPITPCLAAT